MFVCVSVCVFLGSMVDAILDRMLLNLTATCVYPHWLAAASAANIVIAGLLRSIVCPFRNALEQDDNRAHSTW